MKVLSDKAYSKLEMKFYRRGREDAEKNSEDRIRNLEEQNKLAHRKIAKLNGQIDDLKESHSEEVQRLQSKIDVLIQERRDYNELIEQQIELDDLQSKLEAQQSVMDSRVSELNDRESKIGSKEEGQYKVGYADGVADGVRRINEITQKDRDNAMKVAMVAASSHTPVANMKEINNELRLAEGNEDSEG